MEYFNEKQKNVLKNLYGKSKQSCKLFGQNTLSGTYKKF